MKYYHEIASADGYGSDIFESVYACPRAAALERVREFGPNVYPPGRYIAYGAGTFEVSNGMGIIRTMDWPGKPYLLGPKILSIR